MAGIVSASLSLATFSYAQETPEASPTGDENTFVVDQQEISVPENIEDTPEGKAPASDDPDTGTVSGFIWDTQGEGVGGVQVLLVNSESDENDYQTSEEDGSYTFANVKTGTWVINIVSLDGIRKAGPPITVSPGGTLLQNVHVTFPAEADSSAENGLIGQGFGGAIAMVRYALPLNEAISENDLETTQLLLARGEDVNGTDKNYDNITPLFVAVERGNLEIVRLLLEHRANVNAVNDVGETAMHAAAYRGANSVVQYLYDKGANLDVVAKDGRTPLIIADGVEYGNSFAAQPQTATLLRKLGAKEMKCPGLCEALISEEALR